MKSKNPRMNKMLAEFEKKQELYRRAIQEDQNVSGLWEKGNRRQHFFGDSTLVDKISGRRPTPQEILNDSRRYNKKAKNRDDDLTVYYEAVQSCLNSIVNLKNAEETLLQENILRRIDNLRDSMYYVDYYRPDCLPYDSRRAELVMSEYRDGIDVAISLYEEGCASGVANGSPPTVGTHLIAFARKVKALEPV
jgi:hypothetical protein